MRISVRRSFQGLKGERGSPGKTEDGAIKFSDTADNCTLRTAGTVRYSTSQKALQLCDGSAWLPLLAARTGHLASNPGRHCLDILNSIPGEFQVSAGDLHLRKKLKQHKKERERETDI